ncbi:MAG: esterase-like activity of phytase family protein [Hydrogenimonas sp.]|nr:esterase-like activity of phytase family protein [Hydrogenimonas sp.]
MAPKNKNLFKSFKLLDAKEILPQKSDKADFSGISGIAYDKKRDILYAVSDNGLFYRLKIELSKTKREIKRLEIVKVSRLKKSDNKPIKCKRDSDAEGLSLHPKGLLVSFEREPRVALINKKGVIKESLKLPKPLRKKSSYRKKNKMLEAVLYHPDFGVLAAPELPLKGKNPKLHTIYGKKIRLHLPVSGSLTAMSLTQNGNIVVLERSFDPIFRDRKITLTLIDPKNSKSRLIAKLKSADGYRLDNFEGLTHIGDNRFLMISDDNENPLQKRLIALFKIKEHPL